MIVAETWVETHCAFRDTQAEECVSAVGQMLKIIYINIENVLQMLNIIWINIESVLQLVENNVNKYRKRYTMSWK